MSWFRVPAWLAGAVVVGTLASACGGGASDGKGVASATGASAKNAAKQKADPQQAGLDFARCMREHGVDVPDPDAGQGGFAVRIGGGPGDGPSTAASGPGGNAISLEENEAFEACRHFLDDAVARGDGPSDPEMADRALKFAQCMREHGVDMPDPQVNGGMVSIRLGDGLDPNSPTLQAAQDACSEFFGPPGQGPGQGKGGLVTSKGTKS